MQNFDYIIIGSGAAGAIVANRLASSSDNHSICVLEAGPAGNNLYSNIPAAFSKNLQNDKLMWRFSTAPTEQLDGRSVYIPQGKLLGGSTSINGLIYNRGQSSDFDHWHALGNEGWSYQDVLPYFRRSENRLASIANTHDNAKSDLSNQSADSQYRGSLGPLQVTDPDRPDPVCDAFIETMAARGLPAHNDYNGASQRGTGYYQRTIHQGRRVTTAGAFIDPVRSNPNLHIQTGVQVAKILFKDKRAYAVETVDGRVLEAKREIILSAGTVNSAKILQLSGVGPGSLLQKFDIPVIHNLAGVGENFQDHYFVRLSARLKPGSPSLNMQSRGLSLAREVMRWSLRKPSILALSPSIAYAFLNSENIDDPQPDLQFVFTPGSYQAGKVYVLDKFPAATCGFTQQRPESVGHIRITGNDPHDIPELQPNYLDHEVDRRAALQGIKLSREFLRTGALANHYEREEVPGSQLQTDDELLDFARKTGNTGYHLVGTCTMGPNSNPMSVVGSDLKVHGVDGLRVIDASVMPRVTSSNTCAATMMIGEKGADMILSST